MDGELRWTMENRWAKQSTIMPVTGTDWLDLESLWFGFEEQWHFFFSRCSLFLPLDFEMDCTCRCLSVYWVSPICLLKANHENRSGGKKKTSNFHLSPPPVPHRHLKVNHSVPSKHTSNAVASHVLHSYGVGGTQSLTPGWQMCVRGGFARCLHQGASGRCWVSKAGFLIIWSPAHGHGGSCLFLRFHTAPHCLIANAASPHRLLSSMCATLLWSMVNKYERPAARRGMEGGI